MLNTEENQMAVIKEVLVENSFKAIYYNNGVIEIIWDSLLETVEVIHLNQIREVLNNLGGGQKMPLFFSFHAFLTISPDARKDAATYEGGRYTLANALLIDNLAKKILFNFFLKINKPKIPTKGFLTREEAIDWLLKLQKKERKTVSC